MPISIEYDDALDAIDIRVVGTVGVHEIIEMAGHLLAHPKFRPDIHQIFDVTGGGLDLSQADLEQIARVFEAEEESVGRRRRFAIVAARDVDYGQLRMYDAIFERAPGVKIQLFRDRESACRWLASDADG